MEDSAASPLGDVFRVEDAAMIPIFLASPKRRLLLSFVERAKSVAEVAASSGEPLSRVYHRVMRLLSQGLLRIEREEKRDGRPIKYYRAVAQRFFVPIDLLHRSPGSGLAAELRAQLDEELFRSEREGVLFYVDNGSPRVSWFGQSRTSGTAGELWQIVTLRPEAVRAFAAEVQALLAKYEGPSVGGRPYLLHAAFAPRAGGDTRS
jgi:predicted transcriptional regulator